MNGCLLPDPEALVINIHQEGERFYWQRAGDPQEGLAGPFHTRASAKLDASGVLYMEAGKAGIRFVEFGGL